MVAEWSDIIADLPQIEHIQMKRFAPCGNNSKICSLHGFSDASESGYSAVIYLRTMENCGGVKISLMMGKSRVAPSKIKVVTYSQTGIIRCGFIGTTHEIRCRIHSG